jgi:hypothetical protein
MHSTCVAFSRIRWSTCACIFAGFFAAMVKPFGLGKSVLCGETCVVMACRGSWCGLTGRAVISLLAAFCCHRHDVQVEVMLCILHDAPNPVKPELHMEW